MLEILRRSGVDEKQSILARVIYGKEISEVEGLKIKVSAGQSVNLVTSPLFPIYVVFRGSLRCSQNNLSFLDYLETDGQSISVLATADTILLRLQKHTAYAYLKQTQLLFYTLVECTNIILNTDLTLDDCQRHIKLVKHAHGEKLINERQIGRSVFLLVDGTSKLTKKIESVSCGKQVEVFLHSNTKHYLIGEQSLYNLPYNFTAIVDSKFGYFIQIFTAEVSRITSQKIIDLKLDYFRRFQGLKAIQQKLMEFPCEQRSRLARSALRDDDQKKPNKRSLTLKASLSFSNYRPRQNLYQNFQQTQNRNNKEREEPLKFFFSNNLEKVKFELIHKGYKISQGSNHLKQSKCHSKLSLKKRILNNSQSSSGELGKQYLVPIMKRVKLKQTRLKRLRT